MLRTNKQTDRQTDKQTNVFELHAHADRYSGVMGNNKCYTTLLLLLLQQRILSTHSERVKLDVHGLQFTAR